MCESTGGMEDQTPVPPAEPAPPRSSHLGVIIGSIVGGVLLLGFTFAGGAAVGWWIGAHHGAAMMTIHGPAFPDGPYHPGWEGQHPGWQGQHPGNGHGNSQGNGHGNGQNPKDDQNQDDDDPSDAPTS
jgi:hypothetical protein